MLTLAPIRSDNAIKTRIRSAGLSLGHTWPSRVRSIDFVLNPFDVFTLLDAPDEGAPGAGD